MPYIKKNIRENLINSIKELSNDSLMECSDSKNDLAGICNFVITKFILETFGQRSDKLNYHDYNEIIGVLESAKLEMYRRQVAEYEDQKIIENGDL